MKTRYPAALVVLLFFCTVPLFAVTRSWTGATSASWSDASNWSPAGTPAPADVLVFPAGARLSMTNDLPAGSSVGAMTFIDNYTLSGNALTLTGDVTYGNSSIAVTFNAPLKLGTSVRFNAEPAITYGAIDVNGQTLTIDSYNGYGNGPISGSGTILWTSGFGGLQLNAGGTFSGTIDGPTNLMASYPNASFTNARLSGTGTIGPVSCTMLTPGTNAVSHSIGTLNTGPLSISTIYVVDLVPGAASDQVKVAGGVTLHGVLSVTIVSGAPTLGQTFTIIDNDGADPVNGTFDNLPEGAAFAVGPWTFRVSYVGGTGNDVTLTAVPAKGDARVTVTPSTPNAVYGDSTSFSIAVSAVSGSATPSGTVTLTVDGSPAGSASLAGDGTAAMSVPLIPAGAHTVAASYSGDAGFNAASGSATQNVAKAATTMTIDSQANPSPAGTSVSFTVHVAAAAHPALPAAGAVVVGATGRTSAQAQLVSGAATVQLGPFATGDQLITASYPGSTNFEPASATLTQHVSLPALSVAAATIPEGDVAHDVPVRIQLSAASTSRVTVDYQTADGTALAGSDYVAAHGTATFEPGETSVTIPIRILGDTVVEPDETFFLQLSNATGATIGASSTTIVLANDDATYRAAVEYTYATADGLPLRLSFYAPFAGNGPWPLILWIPGNTAYDAAGGDVAALRETARGYAVAAVHYRPAALAPFPAQIRDLQTAVRYLRANAATLNVDARKFVAWGGGAGGHLAALLGSGYDAADADARVQAVIDWGGIADPASLKADSGACSTMDWSAMTSPVALLLGCAPWQCPSAAEESAPARYAGAGDAPTLLMHGLADCFVPARQSQELYDALKAAGVDATLHLYDGIGHDDPFWSSDAAFHDVEAFLDARLLGVSPRPRPIRH